MHIFAKSWTIHDLGKLANKISREHSKDDLELVAPDCCQHEADHGVHVEAGGPDARGMLQSGEAVE